MKAFLYIDNDKIGDINLSVIDESMGAIGGQLNPNDNYKNYILIIQKQCDEKGISNINDLNYKILLSDNSELRPEGGIGVTDLMGFDEIYVESAGLDIVTIGKIKNAL